MTRYKFQRNEVVKALQEQFFFEDIGIVAMIADDLGTGFHSLDDIGEQAELIGKLSGDPVNGIILKLTRIATPYFSFKGVSA